MVCIGRTFYIRLRFSVAPARHAFDRCGGGLAAIFAVLTFRETKSYYEDMKIREYDRQAAVEYAEKWAYGRNPDYYSYNNLGGDCTNFASQCVFAGSGVMNYTPTFGWYYVSTNNRTASWTGVEYFYDFLTGNAKGIGDGAGPFGEEVASDKMEIGDIIQLGRANGDFYHTSVVVGFYDGVPLLAAHSYDAYGRSLTSYNPELIRYIRILGVRSE